MEPKDEVSGNDRTKRVISRIGHCIERAGAAIFNDVLPTRPPLPDVESLHFKLETEGRIT